MTTKLVAPFMATVVSRPLNCLRIVSECVYCMATRIYVRLFYCTGSYDDQRPFLSKTKSKKPEAGFTGKVRSFEILRLSQMCRV